jgi:hypothetical protein
MKMAIVSEEALNAVMGYLGTRPYQEVFKLIEGIQSTAKPFVEPEIPADPAVE